MAFRPDSTVLLPCDRHGLTEHKLHQQPGFNPVYRCCRCPSPRFHVHLSFPSPPTGESGWLSDEVYTRCEAERQCNIVNKVTAEHGPWTTPILATIRRAR